LRNKKTKTRGTDPKRQPKGGHGFGFTRKKGERKEKSNVVWVRKNPKGGRVKKATKKVKGNGATRGTVGGPKKKKMGGITCRK